jgi:RNA polymerase sigma-70 factor (ECF subfamily)
MARKPVRRSPGPSLLAIGEPVATGVDLDLCMAAVSDHGDKAAFGRLVQHFAPRLIGYFVRERMSRSEAEEIASETLATLWRDAALYDPGRATLAAFVFVIARNLRLERAFGAELACEGAAADTNGDKPCARLAMAKLRAALEGEG